MLYVMHENQFASFPLDVNTSFPSALTSGDKKKSWPPLQYFYI